MTSSELLSASFLRTSSWPSSEPIAHPPICKCIITPLGTMPCSGLRMRLWMRRPASRDGMSKLSALSSSLGGGMGVWPDLTISRYLVAPTCQNVSPGPIKMIMCKMLDGGFMDKPYSHHANEFLQLCYPSSLH